MAEKNKVKELGLGERVCKCNSFFFNASLELHIAPFMPGNTIIVCDKSIKSHKWSLSIDAPGGCKTLYKYPRVCCLKSSLLITLRMWTIGSLQSFLFGLGTCILSSILNHNKLFSDVHPF